MRSKRARASLGFVVVFATAGCLEAQRGRLAESDLDRVGADTTPVDVGETDGAPAVDTTVAEVDAPVGPVSIFEGGWLIDQPFHALYEASFYRFERDGTITLVASSPSGCQGHLERFCETGHVSPPDGSVLCRFGGGRWEESDTLELTITNVCDDGVERTIVLDFARFDAMFGGAPEIVEVSGRKGWRHASWEWFFRQCEADLQFGFEPVRCQ